MVLGVWLFGALPAEAKLGPVYQPITHYVPLQFPVLVLAPAFALDLLRARCDAWPRALRAALYGPVFVAVLAAVEWPFASFLMSEASRGWVFGTAYQPYFMHPQWAEARYQFFDDGSSLPRGLATAAIAGMIASYLGLVLGDAVARVRR
jgi:hypothetical protein